MGNLNITLTSTSDLNLAYVEAGQDLYFLGKEIEILKGNSGDHFKRSYKNFLKSDKYQPNKFDIPPKMIILEGETLKSFKQKYQDKYNKSLGSINKLHVLNESAAINYLYPDIVKELKEKKKAPQQQIAKVIKERSSISKSKPISRKLETKTNLFNTNSEHELVKNFILLSSYCPTPFRREVTFINTLKDQTAKTRRFDLYRQLSNTLQVIEVKNSALTAEHISSTIGDKGYLHLLEDDSYEFYFVAPSITPAATRMLSVIPTVHYKSVDTLVIELLKEIKESLPSAGVWFMKRVIEEFLLEDSLHEIL